MAVATFCLRCRASLKGSILTIINARIYHIKSNAASRRDFISLWKQGSGVEKTHLAQASDQLKRSSQTDATFAGK